MGDIEIRSFMPDRLEHLFLAGWEWVFNEWRKAEASQEKWKQHWEQRGYNSWTAWRKACTDPFKCDQAIWHVFRIKDPLTTVPDFLGGPFPGWVEKHYAGENSRTFKWLMEQPDLKDHSGIKGIAGNFPMTSHLIGMVVDGKIYIIEGMHRCCAVEYMRKHKTPFLFELRICLAIFPGEGNLPRVGKNISE